MERANQTLQDRLVKEMRLAGINNIADYHRRFAVVPKDPHDAHLRYQGTAEELTRTLWLYVHDESTKTSGGSVMLYRIMQCNNCSL